MSVTVKSIMETAGNGTTIDVECSTTNGLPNIIIVGFANKAVDEAKERVRSAFASSKLQLPRKRIIINLAPADVPKDSTSFDLAMAVSILVSSEQLKAVPKKSIFIGELGLDGTVRAVRGIIGKVIAAKKQGYDTFYIPKANLQQALLIPGLTFITIANLREVYLDLNGVSALIKIISSANKLKLVQTNTSSADYTDVVGQKRAKRALEIAAAGGHNVLLSGPPGTGKSMLAKALPSILPALTPEEILEITHLHSLASRDYDRIVTERPFRSPHHSASNTAILGGGQNPRPGEISLSHRGVLFLDELPEFNRAAIEALRQPLEDKIITISRAKDSLTFAADFILVATCNPCPCGYYGTDKSCSCLPHHIMQYQRKISGPIMDRIDLYVDVDSVQHAQLLNKSNEENSDLIRNRVQRARQNQHQRYSLPITNSTLDNKTIKKYVRLTTRAKDLLDSASHQLQISARSYMRTIKVAQTIADLAGQAEINEQHVGEALQYRPKTTNISS